MVFSKEQEVCLKIQFKEHSVLLQASLDLYQKGYSLYQEIEGTLNEEKKKK